MSTNRLHTQLPHRWTPPRYLLFLATMLVLLTVRTESASAHAQLETSDPPANAILPTSPSRITLNFTERLEHSGTSARLYNQDGQEVTGVATRPGDGPKVLIVDLPPAQPNGTYSVVWQTLSADDGHPAQGYFAFTIGSDADVQIVVPPATASSEQSPDWMRTSSRWAALLGLALAVAVWPIWLLAVRPGFAAAWRSGIGLTYRARRYADGVIVFALLGNVYALGVQAADLPTGRFFENVRTTLADTRYGELWIVRIALFFAYAASLAAAPWWRPRHRPWRTLIALSLALALPVPYSLIAHGSAETTGRTAAIAIDYVHLVSASLWVGGVFLLVTTMGPGLPSLLPGERRATLVGTIPRFSALALAAIGILGASGSYAAWLHIGSLDGLTGTSYGRSLIAKLIILIPLLGFGAYNLLLVTRRLKASDNDMAALWSRRFRAAITIEAVLMIMLFVAIGRLTSLEPARATLALEGGAIQTEMVATGRSGTLTVTPGATGPNHYRLELEGETLPVDTEALLRLSLASQDLGEEEIRLTRAAGNAFEAHGSELSIAGDWSITAIVRKVGEFQWQETTAIAIGAMAPPSNAPDPAWHFGRVGLVGITLIVASIAGFAYAWTAGQNRLRRESAILAGAALALGVILLVQSRVETDMLDRDDIALAAADEEVLARGDAVFQANCAACHGTGGKGDGPGGMGLNPPPADLTSPLHRAHRPDDIALWVTNGVPGSAMPAFGDKLSAEEIRDVVAYVQSLSVSTPDQAAEIITPDPAECRIAPVHPRDLLLPATPAVISPESAAPVGSTTFPWPQGDPVNDADKEPIVATVREFVACASAGDYPRRLALYTRDYITPQFAALDEAGQQAAIELADSATTPVSEDQRGSIRTIDDVRRLADGRIAAYVVTEDPVNHPHVIQVVLVFAQEGDRWLIDEIHQDTSAATPAP